MPDVPSKKGYVRAAAIVVAAGPPPTRMARVPSLTGSSPADRETTRHVAFLQRKADILHFATLFLPPSLTFNSQSLCDVAKARPNLDCRTVQGIQKRAHVAI